MNQSKVLDLAKEDKPANEGGKGTGLPRVHWDDSNMKTSYANVVNVISSREEFTVFFGTNQTWNVKVDGELVVSLSDRIILNPHAAKRLLTLLAAVVAEYEKRHGKVNIDPRANTPMQ
jgi:hypothetical protein